MKEREGYDAARESREAITDPTRSSRHETAMRMYLAGETYARLHRRSRQGTAQEGQSEAERKAGGSGRS